MKNVKKQQFDNKAKLNESNNSVSCTSETYPSLCLVEVDLTVVGLKVAAVEPTE